MFKDPDHKMALVDMKGNQLSNRHSPIIAFRVEGLLLKDPEKPLEKFIARLPLSIIVGRKVDTEFIKIINYIWRRSDYTINLYSIGSPLSTKILDSKLKGVHYSNLFAVDGYVDLRSHLKSQYTMYYFDNDEQAISVVGGTARHSSELKNILFN